MSVRAKFRCHKVEDFGQSKMIYLSAVCADVMGDSEENRNFTKWTPFGELKMAVDNPRASIQFEEGQVYYLDFTKAVGE